MRKGVLCTFISGCILMTAAWAGHHDLPTDTLPMSQILQDLQHKGYAVVHEIEFEDGMFQVETLNAQGSEVKLRVNPKTGEILLPKGAAASKAMSMLAVVKKLEAQGYRSIYKVKVKENEFDVKGFDKSGKKVELEIDSVTGAIKKES